MILALPVKILKKRKRNLATKWLRPHLDATTGGEAAMVRFLDDPDEPCYTGVWWKPDKNRFHQARGPGGPKKYVRNPNLWVSAFQDSLTAVSVAGEWKSPGNSIPNEGWGCKRGATLLTKRHIVSCGHGSFGGPGPADYPTRIRFVGTDGETYERTVIGQKWCHYPSRTVFINGVQHAMDVFVNGVQHAMDSWIGVLNEDLPPEVVPARCIPNTYKMNWQYGLWQQLFISQSFETDAKSPDPSVIGEQAKYSPWSNLSYTPPNHPRRHRSMCVEFSTEKVSYNVWGGDSGMPTFVGVGAELLWYGFVGGGGVGANGYPMTQNGVVITWEDLANAMINYADDDAISLGAMTTRTGYTVTIANDITALLPL